MKGVRAGRRLDRVAWDLIVNAMVPFVEPRPILTKQSIKNSSFWDQVSLCFADGWHSPTSRQLRKAQRRI